MEPTREHGSILASAERRLLIGLATRVPARINSDHLTVLALLGMAAAGIGYILSARDPRAVWITVAGLFVNWLGDSLDGTLARVRRAERPRYGFYVDHVVDLVGATFLFAGLGLSRLMSPAVALGVLVAYLLVAAEVFLATTVQRVFRLSFARVGPTELRILLAVGTVLLSRVPVSLGPLGAWLPFDVGGVIAILGMSAAFVVAATRNTGSLRRLEPLPRPHTAAAAAQPNRRGVRQASSPMA